MHVVLMKNKPIPEGLKFYVLTEAETGFILNAFLHHSKLKTDKSEYGANFGIVFELLEGTKLGPEYDLLDQGFTVCSLGLRKNFATKRFHTNVLQVVTDNFYSGVKLAWALLKRSTYTLGTLRSSRKDLPSHLFKPGKSNQVVNQLQLLIRTILQHRVTLLQRKLAIKLARGSCVFSYSNCGNVALVCWRDNKDVIVISTDPRFRREILTVLRRDRNFKDVSNRTKEVPQPLIVNRYIRWMRGVDLA